MSQATTDTATALSTNTFPASTPNHMRGAAYHREAYAEAKATAKAYRNAGWAAGAQIQEDIAEEFAGYLDYAGEAAAQEGA